MTRVTAPIGKLTRSLCTQASAPRLSPLLNNSSKSTAARVRKELEHGCNGSERTITTTHRPTPTTATTLRPIPLMQTFFHATPTSTAQLDTSSLDYTRMPSQELLFPQVNDDPFSRVRVPLLPDNFSPDRSSIEGHSPEVPDAPLAMPQIAIVAANPENVSFVSALTEIEGMNSEGIELRFAHDGWGEAPSGEEGPAGGMLTDLWKGLVDDVFGAEAKVKPAL